jgi:hypothetical protein
MTERKATATATAKQKQEQEQQQQRGCWFESKKGTVRVYLLTVLRRLLEVDSFDVDWFEVELFRR